MTDSRKLKGEIAPAAPGVYPCSSVAQHIRGTLSLRVFASSREPKKLSPPSRFIRENPCSSVTQHIRSTLSQFAASRLRVSQKKPQPPPLRFIRENPCSSVANETPLIRGPPLPPAPPHPPVRFFIIAVGSAGHSSVRTYFRKSRSAITRYCSTFKYRKYASKFCCELLTHS